MLVLMNRVNNLLQGFCATHKNERYTRQWKLTANSVRHRRMPPECKVSTVSLLVGSLGRARGIGLRAARPCLGGGASPSRGSLVHQDCSAPHRWGQ